MENIGGDRSSHRRHRPSVNNESDRRKSSRRSRSPLHTRKDVSRSPERSRRSSSKWDSRKTASPAPTMKDSGGGVQHHSSSTTFTTTTISHTSTPISTNTTTNISSSASPSNKPTPPTTTTKTPTTHLTTTAPATSSSSTSLFSSTPPIPTGPPSLTALDTSSVKSGSNSATTLLTVKNTPALYALPFSITAGPLAAANVAAAAAAAVVGRPPAAAVAALAGRPPPSSNLSKIITAPASSTTAVAAFTTATSTGNTNITTTAAAGGGGGGTTIGSSTTSTTPSMTGSTTSSSCSFSSVSSNSSSSGTGGSGGNAAACGAASGGGVVAGLLGVVQSSGLSASSCETPSSLKSHLLPQQPPPPAVPPPPAANMKPAVPSSTALAVNDALKKNVEKEPITPAQLLLSMKINDIDFERKQRRLYIGNLPPGSTQPDVVGFFNGALLAVNAQTGFVKEDDFSKTSSESQLLPVERCEVFNESSRFCFIELRNQEYTVLCIKLDGITYNGFSLRVGRPHDYVAPPGGDPVHQAHIPLLDDSKKQKNEEKKENNAPPRGESGPDNKIYIQNLPSEMGDEQVRDLLEQFGKLRVLNLIKNVQTGQHKGYGFFEYENPQVTDSAIMALNGFVCGANILSVQRATFSQSLLTRDSQRTMAVTNLPSSMTSTLLSDPLVAVQVRAARRIGERPSKVVQLLNCVYQEDIINKKEYETLVEDIKQEAEKHGPLEEIVIPRPTDDLSYREGVGKVFLRYGDVTAARKAQLMLNGRRFDAKVVCAAFFPEERFAAGQYTLT